MIFGDYNIFLDQASETVRVEYPDGHQISLSKITPVFIGIMYENDWVVSLITTEAIQKLKHDITENLEVVGLKFKDFKEAQSAQNFIQLLMFTKLTPDAETQEKDKNES